MADMGACPAQGLYVRADYSYQLRGGPCEMKPAPAVIALAPSFGPAIVTLFGVDVPVFALILSCIALLLARMIAKPSVRRLSKVENLALTALLLIILFLVVTGQLFGSEPLGVGMSVVWAIGLGLSGVLILELFADHVQSFVRAFLKALRGGGGGGTVE